MVVALIIDSTKDHIQMGNANHETNTGIGITHFTNKCTKPNNEK